MGDRHIKAMVSGLPHAILSRRDRSRQAARLRSLLPGATYPGLARLLLRLDAGVERDGLGHAVLRGRIQGGWRLDDDLAAYLDVIPSMTDRRERRFLHTFFALNRMDGPVVELGPYLGGTTRAIATGMQLAGSPGPLLTFDAYQWEHAFLRQKLLEDSEELSRRIGVPIDAIEEVRAGSWLGWFHQLHDTEPYGALLRPIAVVFPDDADDPLPDEMVLRIEREGSPSCVFIDGLKSWPSMVQVLRLLLPRLSIGSYIILQDFSWYDCFWLPVLFGYLGDRVQLVGKVVNTAAFRCRTTIDQDLLDAFPETPEAYGLDAIIPFLENWSVASLNSGDEWGGMGHSMQVVSAMEWFQRPREAARLLDAARAMPLAGGHDWLLDAVGKNPVLDTPI